MTPSGASCWPARKRPTCRTFALDAASWTSAETAERRARVPVLAEAAATAGDIASNPWRGVRATAATAEDAARIVEKIPPLLRALGAARTAAKGVESPAALAALLAGAQAARR